MNAPNVTEQPVTLPAVGCSALLADLLWLEYEDATNDARAALITGDKLGALALAITAHKIKSRYDREISALLFG